MADASHFDYQLSIGVNLPGRGPGHHRQVLMRGSVTAPEGDDVGFGKEAIATALEQAAREARESVNRVAATPA